MKEKKRGWPLQCAITPCDDVVVVAKRTGIGPERNKYVFLCTKHFEWAVMELEKGRISEWCDVSQPISVTPEIKASLRR